MPSTPHILAPGILVSPQVSPDDLADLAGAGVRVLVSHRPDGEEPGQPSAHNMAGAAAAAGLRFVHIPVSGMPDAAAVSQTADVLKTLGTGEAILMFCRSGTRSTVAWALAMRALGRGEPDELRAAAAAAGYDLSRLPL
ncbi:MAG: TIGR01244 family sulfur transferase [Brevundimonas sp.]|uniref:TIGR01244 family sulfur transferase n=1 Tax=Brevundimonas sp. TaxID=1871086 RepID=UPI0027361DA8|nr:TIGR01244 family sulfur transferase [Brevundimonas sp.]MDP3405561.1 TIGR01244 family sulfur transferase [Brevundimonas sp.]